MPETIGCTIPCPGAAGVFTSINPAPNASSIDLSNELGTFALGGTRCNIGSNVSAAIEGLDTAKLAIASIPYLSISALAQSIFCASAGSILFIY